MLDRRDIKLPLQTRGKGQLLMLQRGNNQLPLQMRGEGRKLLLDRGDNQLPLQTREENQGCCLTEETINNRYKREGRVRIRKINYR